MAYSPTSVNQNVALARAMAGAIDKVTAAISELQRLADLGAGQGIPAALNPLGSQQLVGIETPADVTRTAVLSLATIAGQIKSDADGGALAQADLDNLMAFRDSLGVRGVAPIRCSC